MLSWIKRSIALLVGAVLGLVVGVVAGAWLGQGLLAGTALGTAMVNTENANLLASACQSAARLDSILKAAPPTFSESPQDALRTAIVEIDKLAYICHDLLAQ